MKTGDIVRITTQCVPTGLVPDKYARLFYKYSRDYNGKWYAVLVEFDKSLINVPVVDSHSIYLIQQELIEGELA